MVKRIPAMIMSLLLFAALLLSCAEIPAADKVDGEGSVRENRLGEIQLLSYNYPENADEIQVFDCKGVLEVPNNIFSVQRHTDGKWLSVSSEVYIEKLGGGVCCIRLGCGLAAGIYRLSVLSEEKEEFFSDTFTIGELERFEASYFDHSPYERYIEASGDFGIEFGLPEYPLGTETIYYTATNDSDELITVGNVGYVEILLNDTWRLLPEHYSFDHVVFPVGPGETFSAGFNIGYLDIPLSAGTYRLVKMYSDSDGNSKYAAARFNITGEPDANDGIEISDIMEAAFDFSSGGDTRFSVLLLTLRNKSESGITIYSMEQASLELWDNGQWVSSGDQFGRPSQKLAADFLEPGMSGTYKVDLFSIIDSAYLDQVFDDGVMVHGNYRLKFMIVYNGRSEWVYLPIEAD